jgi:uncharacterized protein
MMRELFDTRERPLFGQADPLTLAPLPIEATLTDLAGRFIDERLDPDEALGELVVFAAGHPQRTMLLAYLLADRLAAGAPGTPQTAAEVVDDELARTQPAHQTMWQQLSRSDRVVLAAVADGIGPSSRALAAEHGLDRRTLSAAAERLADQGHLIRNPRDSRLVDPLLAAWLRRR